MNITENILTRLTYYFNSKVVDSIQDFRYDYNGIHLGWNCATRRVIIPITRRIELELCELLKHNKPVVVASFQDAYSKTPVDRVTFDDSNTNSLQFVNAIAINWT